MKNRFPKLSQTMTCYAIILPSLGMLFVFLYLPVLWALSKSLYEFEIVAPARFVGLQHYQEFLFKDPTCWPAMGNMLFLTLVAVVTRLTFPLLVAKLIHSLPSEKVRHSYRLIFLVPIVVPGVAAQLIWMGLIYADTGLLNEILRGIGLGAWATGWLSNPDTAIWAVALVGFPFVGGFEVLIYYAGLAAIPQSVNEAAMLEGCTGVKKFFRIDIPLILSQLKLILILTVIGGVQGFESVFILTRGGPGFETNVPGLWMYFNAFSFQRMGYACAIGVVLFIVILGLTLLNLKYFRSAEQLQEGVS